MSVIYKSYPSKRHDEEGHLQRGATLEVLKFINEQKRYETFFASTFECLHVVDVLETNLYPRLDAGNYLLLLQINIHSKRYTSVLCLS